jgi:hypothetical protein
MVARVLRQVVEAMDGRRPIEQLRPLLTRAAFAGLVSWLRAGGPGSRHTLRSIHTCRPTAAVVEASVVIDHRSPTGPRRVVAAAARFEREGEGWRCTVLVLL